MKYYIGNIKPKDDVIFVFGSNPEGRHGAGAAKVARQLFGAVYGQGEGLQGNSYDNERGKASAFRRGMKAPAFAFKIQYF